MYALNLVSAAYALFLALTILTPPKGGRSSWSRFAIQVMAALSLIYLAALAVFI